MRGEGAVLLDENGRRFMESLHADAELAPRDVVARGIAMQMAAQGGKPVMLDASKLFPGADSAEKLRARFPSIDTACRARGLDWSKDPVPVVPAAHYWMGGIRTDMQGRTSVAGLYAIGEAACTGVHGANRLASNSLLESVVFAWRCATQLLGRDETDSAQQKDFAGQGREAEAFTLPRETIAVSPLTEVTRPQLQQLMWSAAGIERDAAVMKAALAQMERWSVTGTSVHALETRNLLQLARLLTAAALRREESRGAHFRSDFASTESAWQYSQVFAAAVAVPC